MAPSNFSPILLSVRGMPSNDVNATASIEIDSRYLAVRQISAGGSYNWAGRVQTNASWSKQGFIEQLQGFDDPTNLYQAINAQSNVHTKDNSLGGIYSFSYDVTQGRMLNQRVSGFYNSQCCGIAFDYQTFNYGGVTSGFPSPLRSPLLPVVHAGRPRQLLAVQRRDERRAALAVNAGHDAHHRRRRFCRQSSHRPARRRGRRRRGVAPAGRHRASARQISRPASAGRLLSPVTWQAIDLLDAAQVHRAIAELRPAAIYHCAGAAHVGRSWGDTASTLAINVRGTHHLLDGLRRARIPAKIVIPSSAMVCERRQGVAGRRPARPQQSLRAEQARAGDGRHARDRGRPARDDRAGVQPRGSAAGSVLRRVRLCAAHCGHRSGPVGAGDRRGQPRRTPRPHRRARHRSRLPADPRAREPSAALTTCVRAARSRFASCWIGCSREPACPFACVSIRRGTAPTTCRCCSAIPLASRPSLAGCRKSRSTGPSTTCSTTGAAALQP